MKSVSSWINRNTLKVLAVGFVGSAGTAFSAALLIKYLQTQAITAVKVGFVLGVLSAILAYIIVFRWHEFKKFMSGYTLAAVIACVIFVGVGASALVQSRNLSKTKGIAITYDEVSILPAGYFYRQTGTYYINPEHPPLVKFIAAIPSALLQAKMPNETLTKDVLLQDYAQYYWGKIFLFESNNNTEKIIFLARLAVLVTNVLLFFGLYLSIAYIWNKRAAFIALLFIVASPFTLAHAMLVTVDVMAATLSVLTLLWFGVFLRNLADKKTDPRVAGLLTSISLAGALLAKFSAILLVPIMFMSAFGYAVLQPKVRKYLKRYIWSVLAMFTLALVLIVLFYAWHVRSMSTDQLVEQLRYNFAKDDLPSWLHTLVEQIAHGGIFGRAFAEFALGLIKVNTRIAKGAGGVFFLGRFYGAEGAGPLYFPLLYITKLPIVFHLATIATLVVAVRKAVTTKLRGWKAAITDAPSKYMTLLYGAVFMLISIGSTLQIGLRHVFPAVFCFIVLTAIGLDSIMSRLGKKTFMQQRIIAAVGAAILALSMVLTFPHYLSYYNALGGGTNGGYHIATDSNYDWGQDLKELATWQRTNSVNEIYVDVFTNPFLPVRYYLGPQANIYKIANDKPLPPGSYLAVSANQYQNNVGQDLPKAKDYESYKDHQVARVGTSIFIFKVPVN